MTDDIEQRARDVHNEFDAKFNKLKQLEQQIPAASTVAGEIREYLFVDDREAPDLLKAAQAELVRRTMTAGIEAARVELQTTYTDRIDALNRERRAADKQYNDLQSELARLKQRISGRTTPRWCVDDYLRAAAAIGDDALRQAETWARKHGLHEYVDAWLDQRKAA
tara:strand:+ start:5533 stop:6030 length:498 start_codon:yes stop_codon:yes gene_type:complete